MEFFIYFCFVYSACLFANFCLDFVFRAYMRKYNFIYLIPFSAYMVMTTTYYTTTIWFDLVCILEFAVGMILFERFIRTYSPRIHDYLHVIAWDFRDKD